MAPITIPTTTVATSSQLDTPVIIIICVFAYLAFFIVAIFIRQCIVDNYKEEYSDCVRCLCCVGYTEENCWLSVNGCFQPLDPVCCFCQICCFKDKDPESRGFCAECNVCGKAEDTNNCCDCCLSFAQACNCSVPGATTCCDSICGPRKHCDIGDCLTCGLCEQSDNSCCADTGSSCSGISCGCCDCPAIQCEKPECSEIHCLCCTISCRDGEATTQGQQQYPYPPDPNSPYPNYPYPSGPIPTRSGESYPYSGSSPLGPYSITRPSSRTPGYSSPDPRAGGRFQYPPSEYPSIRHSPRRLESVNSSRPPVSNRFVTTEGV
uniref:prestalk D11 protein-like isoform X2 n=1 Tax=Styela clava TaxID=7725 RepID=UPI0019392FF0|nr:prestalk D11 protein-like isoform X2 [Styela clava]